MRETGTDQQVAQPHDRYMMMMMMMMMMMIKMEQRTSSAYPDNKAAGFHLNVDNLLPLNVT